ncbi:hypothetical protein GEMRC1_001355 [Eukaryota sp. GEM-RC1]
MIHNLFASSKNIESDSLLSFFLENCIDISSLLYNLIPPLSKLRLGDVSTWMSLKLILSRTVENNNHPDSVTFFCRSKNYLNEDDHNFNSMVQLIELDSQSYLFTGDLHHSVGDHSEGFNELLSSDYICQAELTLTTLFELMESRPSQSIDHSKVRSNQKAIPLMYVRNPLILEASTMFNSVTVPHHGSITKVNQWIKGHDFFLKFPSQYYHFCGPTSCSVPEIHFLRPILCCLAAITSGQSRFEPGRVPVFYVSIRQDIVDTINKLMGCLEKTLSLLMTLLKLPKKFLNNERLTSIVLK